MKLGSGLGGGGKKKEGKVVKDVYTVDGCAGARPRVEVLPGATTGSRGSGGSTQEYTRLGVLTQFG
jgi:hypothetical protein